MKVSWISFFWSKSQPRYPTPSGAQHVQKWASNISCVWSPGFLRHQLPCWGAPARFVPEEPEVASGPQGGPQPLHTESTLEKRHVTLPKGNHHHYCRYCCCIVWVLRPAFVLFGVGFSMDQQSKVEYICRANFILLVWGSRIEYGWNHIFWF